MNVALLSHTPNPVEVCATAARRCYSDLDIEDLLVRYTRHEQDEFLKSVLARGHLSVLEHASFTFGIEGISRACSHQLVRHRIASYSQQSQRYVSSEGFMWVTPDSIRGSEETLDVYQEAMGWLQVAYDNLVFLGIPEEDARYLIPNAAETSLVMTMNARELLHFFNLRCCKRAQWEIREMADRMLQLCQEVSPVIFKKAGASCVSGKCPEGKHGCKK